MKKKFLWTIVIIFVFLSTTLGFGQLKKLLKKIPGEIPGLTTILKSKPSLTTNISDALTEILFLDNFNPELALPLTDLPRTSYGGFILNRPGFFIFTCQSYCLKAGTFAPENNRGGNGYLYAPLKGPKANIVHHILQGSYKHPEIYQEDIQVLLWAVIARTKISRMPRSMQFTAAKLLTKKEILELEGGALGLIPDKLINKAFQNMPPLAKRTLKAEARLRNLLSKASTTYDELERAAVLQGNPPVHKKDRAVKSGRWSFHPNGYFIRFFPHNYKKTQIELFVPETIKIKRDNLGRIISLADELGNRIETEYNDSVKVFSNSDHPGINGYKFNFLRLIHHENLHPEKVLVKQTDFKNTGWTLKGIPSDEQIKHIQSNIFLNLNERLNKTRKNIKELNSLSANLKILTGILEQPNISQKKLEEVIDLMNFSYALLDVIKQNPDDMDKNIKIPFSLVQRAWLSKVSQYLGSHPSELIFDPATDPVPGNASSQRLGESGRPAENNDCDNLEKKIQNAMAWLNKYSSSECKNAPSVEDASNNVDKGETFTIDAYVDSNTCELVINGVQGASFQEFKDYLMKNGYCSKCADAVVAHEREHMKQCHNQDGQEGRPDFGRSSPDQYCSNEQEAYCTELKLLLESYKAGGCKPSSSLSQKITEALSKCK